MLLHVLGDRSSISINQMSVFNKINSHSVETSAAFLVISINAGQIAFMYVDRKQLEAFHCGMQHFRITCICSNNVSILSDMSIRKETSAPRPFQ